MTKNNATAALASEPAERTEATNHTNIGEAFLAIMNEVGYVQKTGFNKSQNYKFAGERQLIEALRPALLKHQVICIPSEAASKVDQIVTEAVIIDGKVIEKEKKTFRTVIDYTFIYTHVPSQTHIQVAVVGEGVDMGDKSAYKAATGALKYALRQPFLIETGDEPEANEPEQVKSVFPNAAKRNDWIKKLTEQLEASPDLGELKATWEDALPILQELKDSPLDYDNVAYEHMVKIKDLTKASIQKFASE